jgi:hypothetical protein
VPLLAFASPAAALHAAESCRSAAAALRECTEDRARRAATARTDWSGPRRVAFDHDLASLEGGAEVLGAHLTRLAGALDDVAAVLGHVP